MLYIVLIENIRHKHTCNFIHVHVSLIILCMVLGIGLLTCEKDFIPTTCITFKVHSFSLNY